MGNKKKKTNSVDKITLGDLYRYWSKWFKYNIKPYLVPVKREIWEKPLFIHIPKTAGTSISKMDVSYLPGHMPLTYFLNRIPSGKNMPFTLTVVRNPYIRVCSSYYYLRKGGKNSYDKIWAKKHLSEFKEINSFVKYGLVRRSVRKWIHFKPQTYFITDKKGRIKIDYILRHERIEDDWKALSARLQLDSKLPKENVSGGGNSHVKLNEESKDIIYYLYKEDFRMLGYSR